MSEHNHLDRDETFAIAHQIYEHLKEVCPGCSMGVLSTAISMLAIEYRRYAKDYERSFPCAEWIEHIAEASTSAIANCDKKKKSMLQ